MTNSSKWWLGLASALMIGLVPMVGCENETEVATPAGGEIEAEADGEREYESPTGAETEVEPEGGAVEVEQEPAGGL